MKSYISELSVWLGMDPVIFGVIALLCSAGAWMMKEATKNSLAGFAFYPVLLLFSVLAVHLGSELFAVPHDQEMVYLPGFAVLGMSLGAVAVSPLVRLMTRLFANE